MNRVLFPGAMGPDGFFSCFDTLLENPRRRLILKGGPGVGKSTFMHRIHAALCPGGEASTLYFCSGDPDSLDAVAVPHAGLVIMDGTAPHQMDPKIPGARDSIINLGVCLDEDALRPRLPQIQSCMADRAACIRRARACLTAAAIFTRDNAAIAAEAADDAHLARLTRALMQAVLNGQEAPSCVPSVRPVITDAVTSKGEVSLIADNAQKRVIRVLAHWSADCTPILRQVSTAVQAAGYSVEEHIYPAVPGKLLHLTIPELSTLVTTCDLLPAEQTFDFSACIPHEALLRREHALEQGRSAVRLHLHQAIGALSQAKQLHDELESFYVPNMDFSRWQKILDETLSALAPELPQ